MADEDLPDPLRGGQPAEHLGGVPHRAVEGRVARVGDVAGGVERGVAEHLLPLVARLLHGGEIHDLLAVDGPAVMIVGLEGKAEVLHPVVTLPALRLAGDELPLAERAVRIVGDHGRGIDRQVGDTAAEEMLADPAAAANGIGVEVRGPGDEPGGLHEQADPAFGGALRHVEHVGRERAKRGGGGSVESPPVDFSHGSDHVIAGQQPGQHLPVLGEDGNQPGVDLGDIAAWFVVPAAARKVLRGRILEDVGRGVVTEVLPEELQHLRLGRVLRIEDPADVGGDVLAGRQAAAGGRLDEARLADVAERQAHRQRDLARRQHADAGADLGTGADLEPQHRLGGEERGHEHRLASEPVIPLAGHGLIERHEALHLRGLRIPGEGRLELLGDGGLEFGAGGGHVRVEDRHDRTAAGDAYAVLEQFLLRGRAGVEPAVYRPGPLLRLVGLFLDVDQRVRSGLALDDQFGIGQQQARCPLVGRVQRGEVLDAGFLDQAERLLVDVVRVEGFADPRRIGRRREPPQTGQRRHARATRAAEEDRVRQPVAVDRLFLDRIRDRRAGQRRVELAENPADGPRCIGRGGPVLDVGGRHVAGPQPLQNRAVGDAARDRAHRRPRLVDRELALDLLRLLAVALAAVLAEEGVDELLVGRCGGDGGGRRADRHRQVDATAVSKDRSRVLRDGLQAAERDEAGTGGERFGGRGGDRRQPVEAEPAGLPLLE